MTTTPFEHVMAAHCETGTMAAMLRNKGFTISEPMVLGIAGGIFFAYLKPAALVYPTLITRTKPGDIRIKLAKRLGVKFWAKQYKDQQRDQAMAELDALLGLGVPVAVQTDVFYFDYVPEYQRIHFNAHFIAILGKEDGNYLVSDCYRPTIEKVPASALLRARFARGELAPKGLALYPQQLPKSLDLKKAIIAGIKEACRNMVKLPIPFIGVKGMRLFAKKLLTWPTMITDIERLSHETMINVVLEERGTGGAGFRFMYATFLREAAGVLGKPALEDMAKQMMDIGDSWREFSLAAARMGKKRDLGAENFLTLSKMVLQLADREEAFFKKLATLV